MEQLFDGIPVAGNSRISLAENSTSMTINAPAAILLAFYICVGDQGEFFHRG
jgi:methylmalonyl-CoA mutase N-terminal domain/subunit